MDGAGIARRTNHPILRNAQHYCRRSPDWGLALSRAEYDVCFQYGRDRRTCCIRRRYRSAACLDHYAHPARGTRLAYLAQEARFVTQRTLLEEMHASLDYLNALRDEITALETALTDVRHPNHDRLMTRYSEVLHRFEHAGGYQSTGGST